MFIKTFKHEIMKKQLYLTLLSLLLTLFISSCKKCPDNNGNTYNVNQADLPYIIPYNDTSKVRFLKNGTDTLTFTSQGLQNTYISQTVPDDGCSHTDKLQQYSLKMKCNESEFFEIILDNYITFNMNDYVFEKMFGQKYYVGSSNLKRTLIQSININNISYDSVQQINAGNNYFIVKPKYGIIKINTNDTYEIIK